eukprot:m.177283 g.177283  ORF g.177283 m.177283 type:complete len:508 (+) comp31882_c0_seq1:114-1637(+)
MAAPTKATRICICGAGISGLTLAGILSRSLGPAVSIKVIERGSRDRDQGYGLDLDEYGQTALVSAGVYHRFWEMARPYSDIACVKPPMGDAWKAVMFRPRWFANLVPQWWGARPECNRGKLREILLDAIALHNNTEVVYDVAVRKLVHHTTASSSSTGESATPAQGTIELFGDDDASLGEFNLVIDSMGLHSTLRQHRVHDAVGKTYSGDMMVHGMISDPPTSFSAKLLETIWPFGSFALIANRTTLMVQKYGAGLSDNRTAVFIGLEQAQDGDGTNTRSPEVLLLEKMGVPIPTSRASGIVSDPAVLVKYKTYLKNHLRPYYDPLYLEVIDALDRITVRGIYLHGHDTILRDEKEMAMPLVCIGDSMRNCGLGGGGILAMHDAIDLSTELLKPGVLDPATNTVAMASIRKIEADMMVRKVEFHQRRRKQAHMNMERPIGEDILWSHAVPEKFSSPWQVAIIRRGALFARDMFNRWYRQELASGKPVGSDPSFPIYPAVQKAIDEHK